VPLPLTLRERDGKEFFDTKPTSVPPKEGERWFFLRGQMPWEGKKGKINYPQMLSMEKVEKRMGDASRSRCSVEGGKKENQAIKGKRREERRSCQHPW